MTINSPDSLPEDEFRNNVERGGGATEKDGGIPGEQDGVGVGAGDEANTFEPEEAGEAVDADDEEEGPQ